MSDPLAQWLSYRDTLPLAWHAAAGELPPAWAEQNQRVLAAIATLDERSRVDPDRHDAQEFERLHHKFDVMIELLGALLRATQPAPTAMPVRLSREGLSWPATAAAAPAPGSRIDVELYLHGCAPAPLRWRAEVMAEHDGESCARFLPMPEALEAALERHVFTRHRRSVADARSPAGRADSR